MFEARKKNRIEYHNLFETRSALYKNECCTNITPSFLTLELGSVEFQNKTSRNFRIQRHCAATKIGIKSELFVW